MKKLNIFIFTVIVISHPLSTVSAVDFGGSLASSTAYSTAETEAFRMKRQSGSGLNQAGVNISHLKQSWI